MAGGRVLILIRQMRLGGAERIAANLFEVLSVNHDVHMVVLDDRDAAYGMGSNVTSLNHRANARWNLPGRLLSSWRTRRRLVKFKAEHPVDYTYSFGAGMGRLSLKAGGNDRKYIAHHDLVSLPLDDSFLSKVWRRPRLRRTVLGSDASIAVSDAIRQEILRLTGATPDRVVTINNGHDLEHIRQSSAESFSLARHGIEGPYLIAVGRMVKEKRFDHLIRAFAQAGFGPTMQLVICGGDPDTQGPGLAQLARSMGVENHVKFLPFMGNPFPVVRSAAALVLSSVTEGFPNVIVEAMACGTPVISTDCRSGPREMLTDGDSRAISTDGVELGAFGILVPPPRDPYGFAPGGDDSGVKALASAMRMVLDDEQLRCDLGAAGMSRAQRYDLSSWVCEHERLFI